QIDANPDKEAPGGRQESRKDRERREDCGQVDRDEVQERGEGHEEDGDVEPYEVGDPGKEQGKEDVRPREAHDPGGDGETAREGDQDREDPRQGGEARSQGGREARGQGGGESSGEVDQGRGGEGGP